MASGTNFRITVESLNVLLCAVIMTVVDSHSGHEHFILMLLWKFVNRLQLVLLVSILYITLIFYWNLM
jgi:hypothetical protein